MKLILLSDLHLSTEKPRGRLDDFESTQWQKLEYVMKKAAGEALVVQAGDFCDRPRNWTLLFQLSQFLKKWGEISLYTVRGQHDMYMHSPDSPSIVSILARFGLLKLVEGIHKMTSSIFITGVGYGQEVPKPIEKRDVVNILVIHAPIAEAPIFERHDYIDARGFAEKNKNYDIILCGDIHRHFCIKTKWNTILNTGPMMRREANEYNFKHEPCFYWFDTETRKLEREIIPHRPANEVLTREHLEEQKEIKVLLDDFVNSIRKTLNQESPGVDVMANLTRAMKSVDIPPSTKALIQEVIDATSTERK